MADEFDGSAHRGVGDFAYPCDWDVYLDIPIAGVSFQIFLLWFRKLLSDVVNCVSGFANCVGDLSCVTDFANCVGELCCEVIYYVSLRLAAMPIKVGLQNTAKYKAPN